MTATKFKFVTWIAKLEYARAKRERELRAALLEYQGNISKAAKSIDMCRSEAHRLILDLDLKEFAKQLRIKAGSKTGLGRPPV